jgi:hypothetical protein
VLSEEKVNKTEVKPVHYVCLISPHATCLWDNLKDQLYKTNPNAEEEMKNTHKNLNYLKQQCAHMQEQHPFQNLL